MRAYEPFPSLPLSSFHRSGHAHTRSAHWSENVVEPPKVVVGAAPLGEPGSTIPPPVRA
jgi:hypothetical protein